VEEDVRMESVLGTNMWIASHGILLGVGLAISVFIKHKDLKKEHKRPEREEW